MSRDVPPDEIAAAIEAWKRDGYAVIRGVADAETLAALRARFDDLVAGRVPDPGLFFQRDAPSGEYADVTFGSGYEGPDVAYRKIERLERDPLFLAWLENDLFRRIAAAAIGVPCTLYRATVFAKAARTGSETPWHQDGGLFWGLDRPPCLQIWTGLDDADATSGCLQVVPGSHHDGLASPQGGRVPEALVAGRDAVGRAVWVPAQAGDVVLLHNMTWHQSGPNRSDRPRRAFTVSLLHRETRCTRTRRAPRQFVPLWA